jgi:hypothetical protein
MLGPSSLQGNSFGDALLAEATLNVNLFGGWEFDRRREIRVK